MAAVDPGDLQDLAAALDQRILEAAASLAKRFESQTHVMHTYVPSTIAVAATGGMPVVGVSALALEAQRALGTCATALQDQAVDRCLRY